MAQHNVSTSCILYHSDKVLMVKEMQNGRVNWDIPAGGLDQGETVFEGVVREIKEETGISISLPQLQKIFQFKQGETTSFNYLFMYKLDENEVKQIQITETDIQEIRFFDIKEIKKLLDSNNVEHELAKFRLMEVFQNKVNISDILVQV
jgi:ADP-ribose pyrophosphatase YjhB (NUDIX family)